MRPEHLPLLLMLILLALAGCSSTREEVVETRQLTLSGYAYDRNLDMAGPADLDIEVEVYRQYQRGSEQPLTRVRGTGTLAVDGESYTIQLGRYTRQGFGEGPFLSRNSGPCASYFHGGAQMAQANEKGLGFQMQISEDLRHVNGLLALEHDLLGIPEPVPGTNSVSVSGPSTNRVCFDDEGKTEWEIVSIEKAQPSVIGFNLGPGASPLAKLRDYRARMLPD